MNLESSKQDLAHQYLKSSVQYGHSPKEWNPKMAPYLLGEAKGHHIFDLVKTAKLLKLAGNVAASFAKKGKTILFVGSNKISSSAVAKYAIRSESFYINYRWLGGLLTNWETIQKRMERMKALENVLAFGNEEKLTKKEKSEQRKELEKLRYLFQGINHMKSLPDLVIFTNQNKDYNAVYECLRLGIPSICIVDSNSNPDLIPYPIPANDDSVASIHLILGHLADKISEQKAIVSPLKSPI
ncbi:MAG: 30S ribosomal protein S2 [Pedobacter sp.]|nr:MAG: 30S ribosomal protein S2 [Pedobacter sp.]